MSEARLHKLNVKTAAPAPNSIQTNSVGTIYLAEYETLQKFAELNSGRLASMLAILMNRPEDIEPGYLSDMLVMANDLSYQVHQAVKLMADEKAGA